MLSWNCASLMNTKRRDHLYLRINSLNIDIACLQETFLPHKPEVTLPPGFLAIYSNPPPHKKKTGGAGQGLATIIRQSLLTKHRLRPEAIRLRINNHFQCLAVTVGKVLVLNVYVYTKGNGRTAFPALVSFIEDIRGPDHTIPLLIAGDFNHSSEHPLLRTLMAGHLDAHPLLPDETTTRPISRTAPDDIFASPVLLAKDATVHIFGHGDHLALTTIVPGLIPHRRANTPRRQPHEPPPPDQPPRIKWGRLDKPPPKEKEALARWNTLVAKLTLEATLIPLPRDNNLYLYTTALVDLATRVLGTAPPPKDSEPWMRSPEVEAALKIYTSAAKKHNARRTHVTSHALNQARATLETARTEAITASKMAKIAHITKPDPSAFYGEFKRARAPQEPTHHPHLSNKEAAEFWSNKLARDPTHETTPIADRPPLTHERPSFVCSDDTNDVAAAVMDTKNKPPGPDGLHVRLLKVLRPVILPTLQHLFTHALHHGLPPELKRGRTVLIPKQDKTSPDPAMYRPITVLPTMTRVFHKAVDMALRRVVYTQGIISDNQAGFMPKRSTYRQAMIIGCLTAAARSTNQELHAAFLDVEKAFDTISHEVLIEVLHQSLDLPPPWVEAIRLLLLGNTTTILGETITLTRGCLQGSPLSPLLCLFIMEDHTRYIRDKKAPQRPPTGREETLFPPAKIKDSTLHSAQSWPHPHLLLFADDEALVGNLRTLTYLLRHTTAWGNLRRIRYSSKSRAVCLTTPRGRDLPTDPLPLQQLQVPWQTREDGAFRYLGIPVHVNPRHEHLPCLHPRYKFTGKDIKSNHHKVKCLTRLFSIPSGLQFAPPRLLSLAVKCVLVAMPLYPTAVTDVEYDALDKLIFSALRRLLGLPPTTSRALLCVELALWPTKLYGELRTMRFAKEFTESTFYQEMFRPISGIYLSEPAGCPMRMVKCLAKYDKELEDLKEPQLVGGDDQPMLWKTHCQQEVHEKGFLPYLEQHHMAHWTATQRDHFSRTSCLPDGSVPSSRLPTYVRIGGSFATAGILFKTWSLRKTWGTRAACLWCHAPGVECGLHFLSCPKVPPTAAHELHTAIISIHHQHCSLDIPADPATIILPAPDLALAKKHLGHLHWNNMTAKAIFPVLKSLGRTINIYRSSWRPAPGDHHSNNPITYMTST